MKWLILKHKNPININYLEWYMHIDLFLKGHMENYTQNVQTLSIQ